MTPSISSSSEAGQCAMLIPYDSTHPSYGNRIERLRKADLGDQVMRICRIEKDVSEVEDQR